MMKTRTWAKRVVQKGQGESDVRKRTNNLEYKDPKLFFPMTGKDKKKV